MASRSPPPLPEAAMEAYERAGDVVRRVLSAALDMVDEGVSVLRICESLEAEIRRLGARPAFPVNVSINHVAAHYTSPPGDETVVPPKSIVKVDVGAHVDGYIVDAAVSVSLSPAHDALVKASVEALREAQRVVRAGVALGAVGRAIERRVREHGARPVENLTGHLIERYNLHAGKVVPNVATRGGSVMREGEVYAIEPFATVGRGYVAEASRAFIFRLTRRASRRRARGLADIIEYIRSEFDGLPFAERWLLRAYPRERARECIAQLLKRRIAEGYPVLVEVSGAPVSQFEDTLVVTRGGAVPLARTLEIL